ncbi:MAG: hypothetical protein KTR19_00800 [Hyphomicrobiales bacterium]|nr:hypothetical protein [Hyphomicrobiales bacterium]
MVKARLSGGVFAALCVLSVSTPAQAIECDGNYQIQNNGNLIATPYCQDQYLAEVAQEYGMRISGSQIRKNYGKKRDACRLVGNDNRVRNTCAPFLYNNRKGNCTFGVC